MKEEQVFQKKNSRESGFTLIEIVATLIVFGALVAIAVPIFINQKSKGTLLTLTSAMTNASMMIDQERVGNAGSYPAIMPLNIPKPAGVVYTYTYNTRQYCLKGVLDSKTLYASSGNAKPSTTACAVTAEITPPVVLAGTLNSVNAVSLTWTSLGIGYKYKVYRDGLLIATVSANSYMNPVITATTAFYVIAVSPSAIDSAPSLPKTFVPAVLRPDAASVLTASAPSTNATTWARTWTLSWTAVPRATQYDVYDGSTDALIITTNSPTLTTTAALTRGATRTYYVVARNVSGVGPDSNIISLINNDWTNPTISASLKRSTPSITSSWTQDPAYWGTTSVTVQYSSSSSFASFIEQVTPSQATRSDNFTGNMSSAAVYVRLKVTPATGSILYSNTVSLATSTICNDPNATTGAGWYPAVVNTTSGLEGNVWNAKKIWSQAGGDYPGPNYFRKQFYLPVTTTVKFDGYADDSATVRIDNSTILSIASWGAIRSGTVTLGAGCHLIQATVTNGNWHTTGNVAGLQMSMMQSGGSPILLTDTSWDVYTPATVGFSSPSYYQNGWGGTEYTYWWQGAGAPWGGYPTDWGTVTGGDSTWMTIAGTGASYSTPSSTYSYYRGGGLYFTSATSLIVWVTCDNTANVYFNNVLIFNCGSYTATYGVYVTAPAGVTSYVGVALWNGPGSAINPTAAMVLVKKGGATIQRSDQWWAGVGPTTLAPSEIVSFRTDGAPVDPSINY